MIRRLPLLFTPQPEGVFTATSPAIPELITERDTLEAAFANIHDAFPAVLKLYAQEGRPLPAGVDLPPAGIHRSGVADGVRSASPYAGYPLLS